MERKLIKHILASSTPQDSILIQGWVRTRRDSKAFSFIEVNDGTSLKNLQVVVDASLPDYRHIGKATTGSSVAVTGSLVASQGKGQSWEVIAETLAVIGEAGEGYPLQKKGHTLEFLRENAHLRPRTNLFGSVFRVRSRVAYAIHQFFQERDFVYVHTPLITGSDFEGAGEMFQVSTLDLQAVPIEDGKVDFSDDFFGRPTYLTVSGQLEGEAFATALSNIYTFGPTFRADNSNTSRHANEFWMIEPEVAFCNLEGDMDLAETFVKYLVADTLGNCREELEFFNRFVDKGLIERLESIRDRPFVRISYTDAVKLLQDSDHKFEYPVTYGANLQSEHERYLTEVHFQCPVTVHDYPREIKPFYMRLNDDEKTVAAMDVLVPGIGGDRGRKPAGGAFKNSRCEFRVPQHLERRLLVVP